MKQMIISALALVGAAALIVAGVVMWRARPWRTAISVNGRIMTDRELTWRAQTILDDERKMQNLIIPESKMKEAMRHYRLTAAKMWIIKETLLAGAVESGIKLEPADETNSLVKMTEQLKSRKITPDEFFRQGPIPEEIKRRDFREAALIGKYTKPLNGGYIPSNEEIDKRIGELRDYAMKTTRPGEKPKIKANRQVAFETLSQDNYNRKFNALFRERFMKTEVKCPAFPELENVDAISPKR